jgi:hypothetical protein
VKRRQWHDSEPESISGAVIARFLDDCGWHGSAAMVREWDQLSQRGNLEAMQLRAALEMTLQRLHRYEPPAPAPPPVTCKSEWE